MGLRHCRPAFAGGVEVDQGADGFDPVQVLGQAAIAHFGEAESEFHHREHMLDAGADFAPDAVLFSDLRVDL